MEIKGRASPYFVVETKNGRMNSKSGCQQNDEIVLLALGDLKYDVLRCLDNRKGIEVLKLETRYMKKRDEGTGLQAMVRSSTNPNNLEKL